MLKAELRKLQKWKMLLPGDDGRTPSEAGGAEPWRLLINEQSGIGRLQNGCA
jgi:hypothetical protein